MPKSTAWYSVANRVFTAIFSLFGILVALFSFNSGRSILSNQNVVCGTGKQFVGRSIPLGIVSILVAPVALAVIVGLIKYSKWDLKMLLFGVLLIGFFVALGINFAHYWATWGCNISF